MMARHEHRDDDTQTRKQREAVLQTASDLLSGAIGVLEAARRLARLGHAVCSDDHDDDFRLFVAIDSDTDHLPVGPERALWAHDALAAKDHEIARMEAIYRDDARAGAAKLIRRFAPPQ